MANTVRMQKFDPVPDGLYPAVLRKIFPVSNQYGDSFRMNFEITQNMGPVTAGTMVSGMVSAMLTPKSKLQRWIKLLGGNDIQIGQDFDIDILVGRPCVVKTVRNGEYSNVKELENIATFNALAAAAPVATAPAAAPITPAAPVATTPAAPSNPAPTATPAANLEVGDDEQLF